MNVTAKSLPIGPHLERAAQRLIERGAKGPAVTELQKALNAAGAHLQPDGDFGPKTEGAVKDFQRRTGLTPDGVVGPNTLHALEVFKTGSQPKPPAPKPGPVQPGHGRPVDPRKSAEWNRYAKMVRDAGGQVNPGGKPTVLGIRPRGGGATTRYADQFVVLLANGQVKHFAGSTRPGQSRSSLSPDVNGDGVGDVAMLRPGNYVATPNGPHHGKPSFYVHPAGNPGSGNVAAYRDLNHDGFYSQSERDWSRRHGITASAILFHVGFSSPSSIGCQNLPPSNVDAFVRAVGGSGGSFTYTLVER